MKYCLLILCFSISVNLYAQNVGVGTNTPHSSAALDITDSSRGLLIPRLTKVQRLNINAPADGLYVYQTDDSKGFWYFDGTSWVSFLKIPDGASQNKVLTYCDGALSWTTGGRCPAKIIALNCSESVPGGTLVVNDSAIGVNNTVHYTGGNAGYYDSIAVPSTGVTGLTARIAAGAVAAGSGTLTIIISGTPTSSGTASFDIHIGGVSCTLTRMVYEPASISSINCGSPNNEGSLTVSNNAVGVTTSISYTGGNGGIYYEQVVASTGVTGLAAILNAGQLVNGSGSLSFNIVGTPGESGKAFFQINIGGQTCTFSRTVASGVNLHVCGSTNVHNPAAAYGSVLDQEGNNYRTVRIGAQTWMAENLKTTTYRNGDLIPQVTEKSLWQSLENGAYCYYNNDASNDCPYGKLYNWYAASDNRNICPNGWHLPTANDWLILENYLGGFGSASAKMRSTGTQYWLDFNDGATNTSGFSGLPGGFRANAGSTINPSLDFFNLGYGGNWWSATIDGTDYAKSIGLFNNGGNLLVTSAYAHRTGMSVRCIKDAAPEDAGTITSLNCATAVNTGVLFANTSINTGVSSTVSYTGGNEGTYEAQTINSTGVTGLTATLSIGTFANGSGSLVFNITGIPATAGTANFALNIGGQSCVLTRTVGTPDPLANHTCGSTFVHNVSKTYGTLTDQDGNVYKTIKIGAQNWMAENLKATHYFTGDPIDNVTDKATWAASSSGLYTSYNNDPANDCPYGKLYNWYAVNDNRSICPEEWRVPTEDDWRILENYLGGIGAASAKMRSTGTQFWQLFNEDATNETGFSGLPGGYRIAGQTDFFNLGYNGIWWSATASGSENAKYRGMSNTNGNVLLSGANLKLTGYSVRCVQDPDYGTVTGLDCDNAIHTGDIRNATTINVGVTTTLSYTGGNGGVYQAQTISSIGVTGLTATLEVGTFANGSGSLIFQITGKANTTGVASFLLNIGNQTCTFTRTVLAADPLASHTCGSTYVHNVSKTYGSLTDQQGNIYRTIQIGTQEWMAENLKTTIYRNGDPVSNVTDRLTWFESTTGAYCDFNNESGNDCPYGKLYNWYAASDNRNICPTGWHVPSESDWVDLQNQLGGIAVASVKLRSTGVQFWQFFNEGATNESGFSALPGGYRAAAPQLDFYNLGYNGFWWSSTSATSTLANYRGLSNINGNQLLTGATNKYFGHSVRCIKD